MPKHTQSVYGEHQQQHKRQLTAKDKAKATAKSLVEKGRQFLPPSSSSSSLGTSAAKSDSTTFVEHARSYPHASKQDTDESLSDAAMSRRAPSPLGSAPVSNLPTRSRPSSSDGSDGRSTTDEASADYPPDYRSDLGDDFYAGEEEDDVDGEEEVFEHETHETRPHLINSYDGLVYVTDGSSSPSSSYSSGSSSSGDEDGPEQERARRQAMMGNSETSWEDASPATSSSQGLYSPPPKNSKLQHAELPEYRYPSVTASLPYATPSYDPNLAPTPVGSSITHVDEHHDYYYHHYHHYAPHDDQFVEAYTQSAAPSPAISPTNSGASTPRGRNPHPRLLWRSILSSEVIDALDQHHQKIAGCPLPRIEPPSPNSSTLDVRPEREGAGKLDVEVRERDKVRERSRMGLNRKPLSREGRRWSRAVERWGL
ncbi:uncharacterized protein JCM15063_005968 [Sporobolomyces koalae]|uniref:uncharacterized protein n=1 Tax=Sporobolomyces koalae TaxID=500713 RepID=UPI0031701509